jgi:Bifunctional DNA primase/polymerase, N-terminal
MSASAIVTTRPFAEWAVPLAERGLAVIPCPGDDGKSPRGAIKGYHRWEKGPGPDTIRRLAADHGDANIGIITSLSGLTVADVDEGGRDADEIIRRAGDTPLITRTPSGGLHLFYRSNGERSANLRRSGLAVDVKG